MMGAREADRPGGLWKKIWAAFLALVTLAATAKPLVEPFYQSYLESPKIQCFPEETQDRFKVRDEFRSVLLGVKAQIIIRCGENVISIVELVNYYEANVVIFNETSGVIKKERGTQAEYLQEYVNQEIQEELAKDYGADILEKIGPLHVDMNLLGEVKYQNLLGNTINRQCIIGQDNLVQDYDVDRPIIKKRLNSIKLELKATPSAIEEDEKVGEIVRDAVERINARLISKTDRKLTDLLAKIPDGIFWCILAACVITVLLTVWIAAVQAKYHWARRRTRRARKSLIKILSVCIAVTFAAENLGISAAKALTRTEDEKLIYEDSPLAEQQREESFFDPRRSLMEIEEEASQPTTFEKLHILKLYVGVKISQAMLTAYETELEPLYKNGGGAPPEEPILPEWFDISRCAALSEAARDKIEEQKEKCSNFSNPANLYLLEKELTDGALLEYTHLDFENLLDIAADAVACGEQFLTYGNRNINGDESPLYINAEDVALLNGKLYWILGNCLEYGNVPEEYSQYKNCFYAAGFQCVALGRAKIDEDDCDYPKLSYYMGNFSEKMLVGLTEKDRFYQQLGQDAMRYYEEALGLLESDEVVKEKYNEEDGMVRNIRNGITTLEGMGFKRSHPVEAEG